MHASYNQMKISATTHSWLSIFGLPYKQIAIKAKEEEEEEGKKKRSDHHPKSSIHSYKVQLREMNNILIN